MLPVTDDELRLYAVDASDITSRIARELLAIRASGAPLRDDGVDADLRRMSESGLLLQLGHQRRCLASEQHPVAQQTYALRIASIERELAVRNARKTLATIVPTAPPSEYAWRRIAGRLADVVLGAAESPDLALDEYRALEARSELPADDTPDLGLRAALLAWRSEIEDACLDSGWTITDRIDRMLAEVSP